MKPKSSLGRSAFFAALMLPVTAMAADTLTMFKDPNCGCCSAWAAHMRAAGFDVDVKNSADMQQVKSALGVPGQLASCHTATVNGYVIEGHVPAEDVQRLLAERPSVAGIAVPQMPMGSPGMEAGGMKQPYDVVAYNEKGQMAVFSSH